MKLTGIPKSGNHALKKACELLGHDMQVGHLIYEKREPDQAYICIIRDPRNILISWMRFVEKPITLPWIKESLFSGIFEHTLLEWHVKCLAWLQDSQTKVIRYEDLATPAEMKKLAGYLDAEYPDGACEELPKGKTLTSNEKHTHWQEYWTPEIEEAWNAAGGEWMLTNFKYTPCQP